MITAKNPTVMLYWASSGSFYERELSMHNPVSHLNFFLPPKQYMMARPLAKKDASDLALEIIRSNN